MDLHKLIDALGLTERTDNYNDRPHADLWSGSGVLPSFSEIGQGIHTLRRILDDAVEVEEWCDYPYRVVWRFDAHRAHVTYCEGDVSVLIARSPAGYKAIEASADRFYANH
jgi:hypothetical protein